MHAEYSQTALGRGIGFIGIGKHGSKNLPEPLIEEILQELSSGKANAIQIGTFFGALLTKGVSESEYKLEEYLGIGVLRDPAKLCRAILTTIPDDATEIAVKLLSRQTLSATEAERLGTYLLSNSPGEAFRGLAASVLRIRYETEEEYWGLIRATEATYTAGFRKLVPTGKPLIQLAEPFDGVEHSYLITPLLAHFLQQQGYVTLSTVGRSGGPKLALNLLDLYHSLPGTCLRGNQDMSLPPPRFGWALHQQQLSPALDAWVERRQQMLKRPFLATMEKVLNPSGAQILITSVFHITYMEKMVALADMTGFSGVIVLKRGLEGTLAPSIARASGILCAVKQPDHSWKTQSFDADTEAFSAYRSDQDAVIEDLRLADNLHLIEQFVKKGQTGNEDFDKRTNLALTLYRQGLTWIAENGQLGG